MKYCSQCGKELVDEAVVCPNCGCAVQAPVNPQEDKPSTGLNILAFLFPLVGLILFLCFQKTTPVRAKAIGKWALIGFIANTILIIIGIVFSLLLYSVAAPSYYDFGSYNDIVYGISMAIRMIAR